MVGMQRNGVGILLLDTVEPYVIGDPGNAETFTFAVEYRKVPGATIERVLGRDRTLDSAFISMARSLQAEGVRAISGCCGLFVNYQQVVSEAVALPVALSSLLQVPTIVATLLKAQTLGMLVGSREREAPVMAALPERFRTSVVIAGVFDSGGAASAFREDGSIDTEFFRHAVVTTANSLVLDNPSVVTILLETSFFAPYADAVRAAVNLPVYDFSTLINDLYDGTRINERARVRDRTK
jgi:hypothetical protein